LFTLRQSVEAYRYHQTLVADCDQEIQKSLVLMNSKVDIGQHCLSRPKDCHRPRRNELRFDVRSELFRIFGVDLTEIPGINSLTAHTLLAEIDPDVSKFANCAAFASWLGLCPDNRISGGRILSVRTRPVNNGASLALRMAAQSHYRDQSYLGQFFRRMRAKLGAAQAITAQHTNSHALCFTCSLLDNHFRRASLPYGKHNIALGSPLARNDRTKNLGSL
jgi:transposase